MRAGDAERPANIPQHSLSRIAMEQVLYDYTRQDAQGESCAARAWPRYPRGAASWIP